ncbi:antifreeze protein [Oceanicola sp. 502str15]|uniref:antifreeze protein n=1 Tax=Oceanicola sp. 502str15 TaxID=2696061 RepID=UPI002094768A|nr:antifreeze protein [Oceanicola sp. 502str15]MCO6383171.1 antifreeze protein [Oceanicola sp. 502str15]
MSPAALIRLQMQMAMMTMEVSAVIWMRMMGMAGAWNVTGGENKRMVREKQLAFVKSAQGASLAAMSGRDVAAAALRPLRQKTRANASRLAKRGPKLR